MPLVWAHPEYVKLLRSLEDGKIFDMPPHTMHRYVIGQQRGRCRPWREDSPAAEIPAGISLRMDMPAASIILYTRDGWKSQAEVATKDTGLGLHVAEISTQGMEPGGTVEFTWRSQADGAWLGRNFDVRIDGARSSE